MTLHLVSVLLLAGSVPALSDDLEDAFAKLKEAQANKDAALVKKFAAETCALARKQAEAPAPDNQWEKEGWPKRLAYLRDVQAYAEYSLYATALQCQPAAAVDLLSCLEEQNPASKYLDDAYPRYFIALQATGAGAKIPAVAERALKHFPENEDALLVLADASMSSKQFDRAHHYGERVATVLAKHPKPEGLSAADWERKRSAALGRSRWICGVSHMEKHQYFEADKDLRAALPLIKANDAMHGSALFHLGVANYQLAASMRDKARMLEAARFSDQAAAIKGPFAQQAWRNGQAMRTEAQKLR